MPKRMIIDDDDDYEEDKELEQETYLVGNYIFPCKVELGTRRDTFFVFRGHHEGKSNRRQSFCM